MLHRELEYNPPKRLCQWTIELGDVVIEVWSGVSLGNLELQKVRDCVLPTLVGRTGLEPVTP